jgi:hypothetical protein
MKTIKFVAFLFYRYYSKGGTKAIPYFSTLSALVFLSFMHLMQLLIVTQKLGSIWPTTQGKLIQYVIVALYTFPLYLLFWLLIKEHELEEMEYPRERIRVG